MPLFFAANAPNYIILVELEIVYFVVIQLPTVYSVVVQLLAFNVSQAML